MKEGTLHNLITELLIWLLDERVLMTDDESQLVMAMNVLMLKILVSQLPFIRSVCKVRQRDPEF